MTRQFLRRPAKGTEPTRIARRRSQWVQIPWFSRCTSLAQSRCIQPTPFAGRHKTATGMTGSGEAEMRTTVGWVERSETHHAPPHSRWVSRCSTHPTLADQHDRAGLEEAPDIRNRKIAFAIGFHREFNACLAEAFRAAGWQSKPPTRELRSLQTGSLFAMIASPQRR
jgi:hypothetical protein